MSNQDCVGATAIAFNEKGKSYVNTFVKSFNRKADLYLYQEGFFKNMGAYAIIRIKEIKK